MARVAKQMERAIVVLGCTGAGKTKMSIELCELIALT
jgi:tRNA A37 N6-isopentenylltransferase MiaA